MLDILQEAIIDSVKLIPFLFITYLIMEYLEHKTNNHIKNSEKLGPIIGSLLGAVPQCGFSVSATNLYCGRVITLGALIAVYLSTSDEMIPVFLSESVPVVVILKVLLIKVVIGMISGILIDLSMRKKKNESQSISHMCEQDNCHCENGILKSSIKHTVNITLFILVINIILEILISFIGEDTLSTLMNNKTLFGPIIAGIIGIIPNCAASIVIAELYIGNIISAGTMIAGLSVGSGVGLVVLFKENRNLQENFKIMGLLYVIGVSAGIIFEFLGLNL